MGEASFRSLLRGSAERGFEAPDKSTRPRKSRRLLGSHRPDEAETPVFGQPRRLFCDPVDSGTCKARGEGILGSFAALRVVQRLLFLAAKNVPDADS